MSDIVDFEVFNAIQTKVDASSNYGNVSVNLNHLIHSQTHQYSACIVTHNLYTRSSPGMFNEIQAYVEKAPLIDFSCHVCDSSAQRFFRISE